jgi:hypothetical protein
MLSRSRATGHTNAARALTAHCPDPGSSAMTTSCSSTVRAHGHLLLVSTPKLSPQGKFDEPAPLHLPLGDETLVHAVPADVASAPVGRDQYGREWRRRAETKMATRP